MRKSDRCCGVFRVRFHILLNDEVFQCVLKEGEEAFIVLVEVETPESEANEGRKWGLEKPIGKRLLNFPKISPLRLSFTHLSIQVELDHLLGQARPPLLKLLERRFILGS